VIHKDQRYRSLAPLEVTAMISWAAPFTSGEVGILPGGEEFIIANDPSETATAVYCKPVRYDELQAHFVPAADRHNKRYMGYCLGIKLNLIVKQCEQIS
jgi:hypothetical protein